MDSKQAPPLSDSFSGSSPIKTSSSNSDTENVVKNNALKTDVRIGKDTSDSSSDDGGFLSGEEEFEPAPGVRVVVAAATYAEALGKGIEGVDDSGTSSEVPMPIDDVEKGPLDEVLNSKEGGGDEVLLGKDPSVVQGSGSSSIVQNGDPNSNLKVSGGEGFGGNPYNLNLNSNSNLNELVNLESSGGDKVVEYSETNEEVKEIKLKDEVVEEDKKIELLNAPSSIIAYDAKDASDVEDTKLNSEEAVDEKKAAGLNGKNPVAASEARVVKDVVEESAIQHSTIVTLNPEIAEPTDSKLAEADGVKCNSEGESIVEALNVDLSAPGVAVFEQVVENKEADSNKDSKLVDTDISGAESVVEAVNVDSPVPTVAVVGQVNEKEEADEKTDSKLVDSESSKFSAGGESTVETVHVDLPAPGVAVAGQVDEKEEADEKTDSKLVDSDNSKFSEGESIVEAIHIDMQAPGVAVVGSVEDIEEANGNKDSNLVETNAAKFTPEGESIVEAVHVDLPAPGVAVAGQIEDTEEADGSAVLNNGSDQTKEEGGASKTLCNGSDQTSQFVGAAADSKMIGVDADSEKNSEPPNSNDVETTKQEPLEPKIAGDGLGNLVDANGSVQSGGEEVVSAEEPNSFLNREVMLEAEDKAENDTDEEGGSGSDDDDTEGLIFGSSEGMKRFIELGTGSGGDSQSGAGSSRDDSQRIDGQIITDSDEEADTDEEGDGKELFDSAALAALLKAATGAGSENGNITISPQDASRLFSVERPAGLGSSLQSLKPASRLNRSSLFTPGITSGGESDNNLSEEDKKKLEKLQSLRVKFLRLVQRLGLSVEESVAAQVLYRLALVAGRQTGQLFSLDAAKRTAMQLEAEGKEDLDFSVNILVLGKSGVGKSATINSIFGEEKAQINAFEPATTAVKEISGMVDGVNIRVFDTPGLRSSAMEQAFNRSVLSSVKKFTKKSPPDIVFYVDRLDAQTRDLNDLPLLRMITNTLGPSIWRSAIVTLTHAASAPPEGPNGSPLSYEVFVTQRSHVVQQSIGQAVGDLRMMSPSLMNPVTLVENHPSCRKNREGQKVLPNGQSWRPQLLLLSYSMKILAEANSVSKPQDPLDHRKLFGFRVRSPPLPYMLSSMLQSRAHPKLSTDQGGEDSDVDLADLSDSSDQEEDEDEYDQLPPFKPLKKAQLANLSKEQKKAYFEEYDYRVKLLQKKQWKEEVKRMREMKKRGTNSPIDDGFMDEDGDPGAAAPVAVPLPDMVLPPSFDGDNAAYRYRFLEPTSQFLARPVLDTHGWDHDCGYDGVNVEQSLAIASRFPAVVAVQVTKDKKEFNFNLDSSVAAKHGDNGSTMAGFDIQPIGKQLAYIVRGETKFKNLKKNKTAAGVTVTFLGENIATGFKVEDQIVLGKQYVFVGSAGTVRSQQDAAYGANIEVQRRELGYPIGQVQSSFGLSIIKWRGDLALGFNSLAQFSVGRGSKVAVRAGINNKLSGQITIKTSSSEHLSLVLAGVVPTAIAIYKKIWPDVNEKYSIY